MERISSHLLYKFTCFYLIFGVFLADVLPFSFLDEICELLFLFLLISKKYNTKEFHFFLSYLSLLFLYSLIITSNVFIAILLDALQQIKPFVYFYFAYYFFNDLSNTDKKKIQNLSLILAYLSFGVGTSLDSTYSSGLFKHPTNYGMSMFTYAMIYYYYSNRKKREMLHFIIITSLGLLCGRSKYYGYYICSLAILYFISKKIRISMKYIAITVVLVCTIFFVAQEKILAYTNEDAMETQARTVLYLNTYPILVDYFPFGSGLSSYATWFSGIYYSRIYKQYGIDSVYGLENVNGIQDSPNFIADTYFPCLAQVGILGVILFVLFWIKRLKELNIVCCSNIMNYKIGVIIIIYSFIESLASPMLVTSYSLVPMIILGTIVSKCK